MAAAAANLGTETETPMASLPAEIITHEIFSKLPAKSLLRFKCVSKSFNSLISSPEFIKRHVRESRSLDANRLLILAGTDNRNLYSIDVDSPDDPVTTIPLPRTLVESKQGYVSIVGSVDGLICVELKASGSFSHTKYIIVNPSTRLFREIPYRRPMPTVFFSDNIRSSIGFVFDDLNDDYKLVRVSIAIRFTDLRIPRDVTYREVIVYSLNQSTWKLVELVQNPKDSLMDRQNGVVIKNHLIHWVFSDLNHNRIVCFDTRSDKWVRDVPLPMEVIEDNNDKKQSPMKRLGVINGCLCLTTYTVNTTTSSSLGVVWMLKDYQAKESWIKLFHIHQFFSSYFFEFHRLFFCFRRESKLEVLVPNLNREGLSWFDVGQITYGGMEEVKRIPSFYVEGCFITESLVQIPGGRHISRDKLDDFSLSWSSIFRA